jgi:hypothetical protein
MQTLQNIHFVYFAYQGKEIVFRFIIEYNSLMDLGPHVVVYFYMRIFER